MIVSYTKHEQQLRNIMKSKPWPETVLPDCKRVGYWGRKIGDDLPMPVPTGDEPDQDIINYLKAGDVHTPWLGYSTCRLCGCMNGTECLTDGTYMWPSGLAHYVEVHWIEMDEDFVAHVKNTLWTQLFGAWDDE